MERRKDGTLEDLVDGQYQRVHLLDKATMFIKGKHNIKNELEDVHNELLKVSSGIEHMRKDLERMKEHNSHCRKLLSLIEALNKRIVHQENNVPPELIQGYLNAEKQTYTSCELSSNVLECTNQLAKLKTPTGACNNIYIDKQAVKDCKRILFSEPEVQQPCPTIPFITTEEFNKVPKYIIGRQSLETINSLVNAINQTLIAKYSILSLGKIAAQKKGEINLYLHYKKQEIDTKDESGYLYFFTADDYHRQTKTKLDKIKLNLMTALRQCKRLRECRVKNERLYVIIPH